MTDLPDFHLARQYALTRLEEQLSPLLIYHSINHTRDDVLPAAQRLARLEGLSPEEELLLYTAVLYHDIGFTVQVDNHEPISAQIAAQMLPSFGYSPRQIRQIGEMILVTKLFTPPKTLSEAIMVDADLDVLGRKDFLRRNHDLRREANLLGRKSTDEQWLTQQIKFMNVHCYRTISAQSLRNAQKQRNLLILTAQMEKLAAGEKNPLPLLHP